MSLECIALGQIATPAGESALFHFPSTWDGPVWAVTVASEKGLHVCECSAVLCGLAGL